MNMAPVLAVLMLAGGTASASDLLGPIWHLQGKHIGDGEPLTWTIEYFDEWGRTVVDGAGGHFYHARCCGGYRTDDPSWKYARQYWGRYPMYYMGTTMRYRITLTNTSQRSYMNLRVVAIQEYLTEDGSWGERLGPDAARDWYLPELRGGESRVFEGSLLIPSEGHGGLDQTHLQVQHWDKGAGQPGPGSVIIDDTHAAIWCPPDKRDAAGAAMGISPVQTPGTALVTAGTSGGGRDAVVRIDVAPLAAGWVTVRIFDRGGTLVRELHRYVDGTADALAWDGTDSAGRIAATGVYLVTVEGAGIRTKERVVLVR